MTKKLLSTTFQHSSNFLLYNFYNDIIPFLYFQNLADQGLDLRNVKDVFGRMIFHLQDSPSLLNISGQDFVLPENCSFLLSDASNLNPLVVYGK